MEISLENLYVDTGAFLNCRLSLFSYNNKSFIIQYLLSAKPLIYHSIKGKLGWEGIDNK